jgi:hypothetical protein
LQYLTTSGAQAARSFSSPLPKGFVTGGGCGGSEESASAANPAVSTKATAKTDLQNMISPWASGRYNVKVSHILPSAVTCGIVAEILPQDPGTKIS